MTVKPMAFTTVEFETKTENPNYEGVFDIAPAELQQKMNQVKMIDVRQPDEFTGELGHVGGAELIVLDTLPSQIANLPKDQTIVFICRSGARSGNATAYALMNGFTNVYNMKGGMLLWNQLQLPVER
ncbi:rhodanese-like domain-containing protein [Bdellovibrio svalbardensis]|uniref:Rhodanese-like domain-containing protein n=1 Tax=Bdellovibrio svalbardensis TaxID=2972972 RepID=A0ABT6DJH8_9BACT|nr:rhodanese-like domain-containing protein [Bdellovibrio svalbardensis]MDG0815238.1 rhodanese-like domain-containing protein [Bdellovibrio svalbardensis]